MAGNSSSSSASPAVDWTSFQLPKLTDDNFEQWSTSLRLVTLASGIQDFLDESRKISGPKLSGDEWKLFYSLANVMILSMNEKTRRIAMAGYDNDAMTLALMLSRLLKHFNPMSNVSDIQLRHQLYSMRWLDGKSITTIANDIRFISNKINFIEKTCGRNPMTECELIAVLIMDAPSEYATEVSLIKREHPITFEHAIKMLQIRESRIQQQQREQWLHQQRTSRQKEESGLCYLWSRQPHHRQMLLQPKRPWRMRLITWKRSKPTWKKPTKRSTRRQSH